MSERYWDKHYPLFAVLCLSLVMAGVVLWDALEYPRPGSIDQTYETSEYAAVAKLRMASECSHLKGPEQTVCYSSITESEQGKHRTERDLSAQRYMAFWAGLMAFCAFLSVLVSGLGVWFVKRTLDQTAETNRAALDAASAAHAANAIMRNEQRPWLTVEIIRPIEFMFSNEKENRFSCYLRHRIKNKGKMPARYHDVQVKFSRRDWGFVAAGSEDAARLHINSRNRVRSRASRIVFPGEEVEGGFWGAIMELEGVDADIEHATVFVTASIAYWLDAKGEEIGCTTASHVLRNEEGMFGPFAYNIGRVAEYGHID